MIPSSIKPNLYYEIKDKVIEEQHDGTRVIKRTQKTKIYGLNSTKSVRELLIQILRERMDNHKDKFVSKRIYDELVGMEVKKNGKVEHSSNTHDDLVFSYLMAMYMWYEGKDLKERFGIVKTTIKTDEDIDEVAYGLEEKYSDIIEEITEANPVNDEKEYSKDLKELIKGAGKLYQDFLAEERKKDENSMINVLRDVVKAENARRHYAAAHGLNEPTDELINIKFSSILPNSIFNMADDLNDIDPNKNPNDVLPSNWDQLDSQ